MSVDITELVRLCRNGDEKAMAEIIAIHKQLIFTIAYRMLHDYESSLDVCQETFIKAFRNIHRLKNPEYIKAWLCCIARNLIYDRLRKRKRQKNVSLEQIKEPSAPDQTARIRKRMIIQKALDRLKEQDRLLLVLFYYQNMDIKEIAGVVGKKPANIKTALSRARVRLRKELNGYEEELLSS